MLLFRSIIWYSHLSISSASPPPPPLYIVPGQFLTSKLPLKLLFSIIVLNCDVSSFLGIDISKCPPLRLPANGYVVCDHLIGAFCAPVCNSGFVPETQPAQAYVCNPLRKAWATYPGGYPLPWPNCIRSTKPWVFSSFMRTWIQKSWKRSDLC